MKGDAIKLTSIMGATSDERDDADELLKEFVDKLFKEVGNEFVRSLKKKSNYKVKVSQLGDMGEFIEIKEVKNK